LIELGGNITLTGFQDRDYAELIVVKKIVGRYARQISDQHPGFESLAVTLKPVHQNAFELHGRCRVAGKSVEAEATERNLFVTLDLVLKRLAAQCAKK